MPFCPNCRYEYTEGARRCSTCGAPLVDELPPQPEPQPRVGFAPADGFVNWFARGPFWRAWIQTARQDLTAFPRYFARGAAIVFRHPILYLIPLLFFAGDQCLTYRRASVAMAEDRARPFIPPEQSEPVGTMIRRRVAAVPKFFASSFLIGRSANTIRQPIPWVPLPTPEVFGAGFQWYGRRLWYISYLILAGILGAAFHAGLYGRLRSRVMGEPLQPFTADMGRYFLMMAELDVAQVGLAYAFVGLFNLGRFQTAVETLGSWMLLFGFAVAAYAVAVDRVHLHRAIMASARFVLRHLPAMIVLLAAIASVHTLIGAALAPDPPRVLDTLFVLKETPVYLLFTLFNLCIWGMMMQWYVEATARERGPRPVSPEAPSDRAAETAAIDG